MSHFIATRIGIDNEEGNKIFLIGCDNNVRPRYSGYASYEKKRDFFLDMYGSSTDISRCNTKFAKAIKQATKEVLELHRTTFPKENKSIERFSPYSIKSVLYCDKEESIKNTRKSYEQYEGRADIKEKIGIELITYEVYWDTFVSAVEMFERLFFERIKELSGVDFSEIE